MVYRIFLTYDMTADGLSLDDKRQPVQENDIPDLLQRWHSRVAPNVAVKDAFEAII
ncbi:hypothetical protein DSM106972_054580 [Dulcicalothrix desertica PCC 7102]|uniref:Uncharacterized protein n=1 Tax=Dulcicalothrix desertica PCC 7102 TaxID=232991 RepID=A0A433VAK8_9CYAN|nr:hypothetical protein [Dulcicalothrix desertica]RUT03150.1 hypothetical protein DSM106972_054580 [Dulcicalothrix desertica PCC 7102]